MLTLSDVRMAAPHFISIHSESDIIAARMAARDVARSMRFSAIDQARIATVASELARNILLYAGEGSLTINQVEQAGRFGIEMIFEDHGPGIAELDYFLNAGNLRSDRLGLAGSRRLLDDMHIETAPDVGTRIVGRKWRR